MKHIYTAAAQPAQRTVTIADMRAAKGQRKLVQVTANNGVQECLFEWIVSDTRGDAYY